MTVSGAASVSVIYADLAGFTAMSHAADPEEIRALQRPFHAETRREVEKRGGSVEKFIGDAVVASFPDPNQAVEAGGAIVGAVQGVGQGKLAVRIGVATGEREDGEVPGVLVEVASRLQALAGPNCVCFDEPTRLVAEIDGAETLAPMVLPGRPHPAPAHRLSPELAAGAAGPVPEAEPEIEAEERKTVSVLFCDLFHLAALSHSADPRDLRATERPSYGRLKREIERFGGTVEKFVGDALMAVFGAPVTRDDDAERAVGAALRIVATVAELNETDDSVELGVRVGVNTGEAVVALSARPEEGEGIVTGDTVNTAARLLGKAPFGGVAVGQQTYEATSSAFEYEHLDAVIVKGIPEPVQVFSPKKSTRAQPQRAVVESPFVGRGPELALLKGTYVRSVYERNAQLVVLTGKAGLGKSRLLSEFRQFVDDQLELALWRQGRCPPLGEGMAFAPLSDIVEEQAGILETDSRDAAAAKLREALVPLTPDAEERTRLAAAAAPLVGADAPGENAGEPAASFAGWRRLLELLAGAQPLVVAIDDLQWASEGLLEFLEQLADARPAVPLLVVATARPELYERKPDWARRRANVTHAALPPLAADDELRLLRSLLPRTAFPDETLAAFPERSDGNPLYTVETVRLLLDRDLARDGAAADELELLDSAEAVIEARIEALPPERRALLQDASVVGGTFWAGAVAALGAEGGKQELAGLVERGLIRAAAISTVKGDEEYRFAHALVRDVAYRRLAEDELARKHRAAARWIESIAGDRLHLHAEELTHHQRRAAELESDR